MAVSLGSLRNVLLENVAEIRFVRRKPKRGQPPYRRMLCTNNLALLTSQNGRITLNYRPAAYRPHYYPDGENLLITWDLMMQDYRNINMDNCDLLQSWPADESFWEYFNANIYGMTPMDKHRFNNS